ncbi:MAG: hypothetical protein U9N52_04935 [Campylobacterota bacterium]|nr:hypothetical protein [Campylobacterota bacterium]
MLNVQELERQWIRYKIKYYLPKALLILAITVIGISLIIFIPNTKNTFTTPDTSIENTTEIATKNSHQIQVEQAVESKDETINSINNTPLAANSKIEPLKETKLMLKPSLGFINELKHRPQQVMSTPKPSVVSDIKIEEHKNIPQISQANTKPKQTDSIHKLSNLNDTKIDNNELSSHFTINTTQEEADIQEVIKRFKNNKNPALSLFAAKRFYAIKKYSDAYNYALMTNELNSDIEESWLIAAKSMHKLGKKNDSIHLLNQFINKSNSMRAKMILEQINNGTLQ